MDNPEKPSHAAPSGAPAPGAPQSGAMSGITRASASIGLRLAVFAIAMAVIAFGLLGSRPPRTLTIEVGPVGGSYYENAQRYRALLADRGIDLQIVSKPNSLEILDDVARLGSGVDIGFIAQDVSAARGGAVATLDIVQLQPLFIFASADLGRRSVIDDLRGRRIVMPPANSATSAAAVRLLQLYDITRDNSAFTFMPLAEAAKELRAGHFDAGVFMLTPENQVIRTLANDTGLRLMPIGEARAIANFMPFLRPVVLPRGIYDIADSIPPTDVPMLAAPVSVVGRKGLHPWLAYSLLEVIDEVHRGPTMVSAAGEYPGIVGSQLEVDPRAMRFHQSGTPWIWRDLPPWLGGFVDRYDLALLGMLLLGGLVVCAGFVAELALLLLRMFGRSRRRPV